MIKSRLICGCLFFLSIIVLIYLSFNMYNWTNGNNFIGIFVPKNKSLFEQLKLLFYPISLIMIASLISNKFQMKIFSSYSVSLAISLFFVIISYYTYSGIIGKNYIVVDVILFIISIIIFVYFKDIFIKENVDYFYYSAIILYIFVLVSFIFFTISPPNLAMFK